MFKLKFKDLILSLNLFLIMKLSFAKPKILEIFYEFEFEHCLYTWFEFDTIREYNKLGMTPMSGDYNTLYRIVSIDLEPRG